MVWAQKGRRSPVSHLNTDIHNISKALRTLRSSLLPQTNPLVALSQHPAQPALNCPWTKGCTLERQKGSSGLLTIPETMKHKHEGQTSQTLASHPHTSSKSSLNLSGGLQTLFHCHPPLKKKKSGYSTRTSQLSPWPKAVPSLQLSHVSQ